MSEQQSSSGKEKEGYFSQFAEPVDDEPNHKRFLEAHYPEVHLPRNIVLYIHLSVKIMKCFLSYCVSRHQLIVNNIVSKPSYNVEVVIL